MISPHCENLDQIHSTLLSGDVEDVELLGNALTALVAIVRRQEKQIKKLKVAQTLQRS